MMVDILSWINTMTNTLSGVFLIFGVLFFIQGGSYEYLL